MEKSTKLQTILDMAEQSDQTFDGDALADKEVREQLEEALKNLTWEDLENYENFLPFQGEIEKILKDFFKEAQNSEMFLELQITITDLTAKAKQRQICKNNTTRAKEYDASIHELLTKVISMIKALHQDAQRACSILTQKYVKKMAKDYNLDKAMTEAIQKKLWLGVSCIVGGVAFIAAAGVGTGAAFTMSEITAFGAMGLTVPGAAIPAFAATAVLLIGIGTWKVVQSRKLKKKHPTLVKLFNKIKEGKEAKK